jgi:phosphotransferase system HPr (HPr) family protein
MTTRASELLSPSAIEVGLSAPDRVAAIDVVGRMLVGEGLVTDGYVVAMQEREAIISTYLGNGIALPHGTSEAQDTILRTGLAVAQFPDSVAWADERALLVIGLAARSEEHIAILSRLASILEDAALCERLARTADPLEIHGALMADADTPAHRPVAPPKAAEARTVRIANPHGLHARPAAQIVERAMAFDAEVRIAAAEREANAISITQVIALGATVGDEVTVSATGDEAGAALDAVLGVLLADGELP